MAAQRQASEAKAAGAKDKESADTLMRVVQVNLLAHVFVRVARHPFSFVVPPWLPDVSISHKITR